MKKRLGIRDYLVWGILAVATILLAISLSFDGFTSNLGNSAERASKAIQEKMDVLDSHIDKALEADRQEWIGHMDLPKDMVIYRYFNDSLQSWCNQFPVKNDDISIRTAFKRISRPHESIASPLVEIGEKATFVNYGEKWYLAKTKIKGACQVIAGIEILNAMDDNNPGGINPSLNLKGDFSIVPLSETGGEPVMLDGEPVFKVTSYSGRGTSVFAHSALVWLAIALFVIAALLHLRNKKKVKRLYLVLAWILGVCISAFLWGETIKDSSKLFSPSIYADGKLFNSLGAILICAMMIVLLISCVFFTRNDIYRKILQCKHQKAALHTYAVCIFLAMIGVGASIHIATKSIIFNSNIVFELYRLNDLTIFSLLVYAILMCMLMTIPMLFQMILPALKRLWNVKVDDAFSVGTRALTAILCAAYMVMMTATFGFQKEKDKTTVLANRLSVERDITLELELRLQEEMIANDQYITTIAGIRNSGYFIRNRIIENQFSSLSQDYDINVEMFLDSDKTPESVAYFTKMVSSGTTISDESRFRYIRDDNGNYSYVGSFAYYSQKSGLTMMLVEVSPKSNKEDKGYASMLGYSAPGDVIVPARYSYAKYSSGKLTAFRGSYAYPTVMDSKLKREIANSPEGTLKVGDYTHFVNLISDDEVILISRPKTEGSKYIVAFMFLALTIYFFLSLLTIARKRNREKEKNYYKSRINAAMMLALIMTLIVLSSVSVLFVYRRNISNLKSSMVDKVNTIQTMVQSRCRYAQDHLALSTSEYAGILDDVSNTLKSDITLYTTDGKEFRSTTPEVFERMFMVSRMNPDAFENIIYKNRRYYIGRESVGSTKPYFLYAPVFNGQGKMIAILSSPFTDQNYEFKSEAVLHSVTIITVFMILLILARIITEKAVDKMFKPLSEMGRKMNEASIEHLEYIVYERDDEVSSLVRAYNLMVHDLYNSTKQLTQNERDKAWATMARQVAHEIKNPLTPIKLQIQRIIRMKSNGNPAWADRFDDISKDVLNQIDLLADTANEFSTFAKLYTEESVKINLDKLLKEEIELFDSRENIEFSYMGLDDAMVEGPKPQLTRVLTNLISNAVQAVENYQNESKERGEEAVMGKIVVSLRHSTKDGFYDIVIEDNGPGVSEENRNKLFTPNFTTKSNGTGLGLSICRSIMEKCNGEILYSRSFSLKGACFTIRFPKPLR